MQNIKKYFMTLALLLTAATGAWAQSSLKVVELEVPAGWANDFSNVTAGDLTGFSASTLDKAQAWTGAPTEGNAVLFYAFNGDAVSYIFFDKGEFDYEITASFRKDLVFSNSKSGAKFYYTAEPTEWSLTPDADKKVWTLAEMPASNVELQVEYYAESNLFLGKEALADKANITVKNGETTVEFGDDGKSTTTVTEGNTVTAKFTGKKVLGMKVEKKASTPSLTLTSPEVGQVIGSDGKNYAYGNLPDGVTPVAKIYYVSGSNGLALALTDEEGKMNWSTAQTTCAAHTPAFTGGTWKLATKDEWSNMITAAGSYTNLRDGFSSVGGTNMLEDTYWSSTERDSDDSQAWVFFFNFIGNWSFGNKEANAGYVRPCLAF